VNFPTVEQTEPLKGVSRMVSPTPVILDEARRRLGWMEGILDKAFFLGESARAFLEEIGT
jgi:hypothetical protein